MNYSVEFLFERQAFLSITGATYAMRIIRSIGFHGANTRTQWY